MSACVRPAVQTYSPGTAHSILYAAGIDGGHLSSHSVLQAVSRRRERDVSRFRKYARDSAPPRGASPHRPVRIRAGQPSESAARVSENLSQSAGSLALPAFSRRLQFALRNPAWEAAGLVFLRIVSANLFSSLPTRTCLRKALASKPLRQEC